MIDLDNYFKKKIQVKLIKNTLIMNQMLKKDGEKNPEKEKAENNINVNNPDKESVSVESKVEEDKKEEVN